MTKINRVLLLILMTVEWTMLSEVVRKGYKYKRPYSPVDAVFCFLEKMGLQRAKHSHWTSPLVREMILRWNKKKKKKLPEVASSLWTSASFMMVRLTETDTHLYWSFTDKLGQHRICFDLQQIYVAQNEKEDLSPLWSYVPSTKFCLFLDKVCYPSLRYNYCYIAVLYCIGLHNHMIMLYSAFIMWNAVPQY